jgi:hypothetical protein
MRRGAVIAPRFPKPSILSKNSQQLYYTGIAWYTGIGLSELSESSTFGSEIGIYPDIMLSYRFLWK